MDQKFAITVTAESGIDKYPAKAHAQRVADKLGLDTGLIVLKGEKDVLFSDSDQTRPFRQNRYFYYFSGCNEPGCYITYDIGKDKLTLWLPPVHLERAFFDGRGSTPEEAMEKYDVDEAKYMRDKKPKERLGFMIKKHIENDGVWAFNKFPRGVLRKDIWFEKADVKLNIKLRRTVDQCRAIKDVHEIELIKKANAVSTAAHVEVLKRLPTLKAETEVEAVYTGVCLAQGAKQQSYSPICGAGVNAGQLHYMNNNCAFDDAHVLLIDAGAEWKRYASDVTRTIPINSANPGHWASKEAEQIYNVVAKIQESCISKMRPGNKFIRINWHAQHMVIDALLNLGILKGEHMDIFHAGTFMAFFPHGLGHHLGLEVHDVQPVADREGKDWINRFANAANAYRNAVSGPCLANVTSDAVESKGGSETGLQDTRPRAIGACTSCWQRKGICTGPTNSTEDSRCWPCLRRGIENCTFPAKRSPHNQGLMPGKKVLMLDQKFTACIASGNANEYGLNPAVCMTPNTPNAPPLEPGNVVTIEPGIYFNKFILDTFYLNDDKHKHFIDVGMLKRYMHVGGVRIEDDILITKDGYENLTTTPKGEEAFQIIRDAAKQNVVDTNM